ncbi:cytoglobin-1-like isoform X2 [Planococcus citri]
MTTESKKIFADDVVKDVQSTWATINSDLQVVGYEIFQRLFTAYPDYQKLFKAFSNVPTSELKNNPQYSKHAFSVANALNSSIENLENADKLVSILTSVGKKHVKRNVTESHYSNVQVVILNTIKECLGDKCNDQIAKSWNEVVSVAVSTIKKGAEEEEAKYL